MSQHSEVLQPSLSATINSALRPIFLGLLGWKMK